MSAGDAFADGVHCSLGERKTKGRKTQDKSPQSNQPLTVITYDVLHLQRITLHIERVRARTVYMYVGVWALCLCVCVCVYCVRQMRVWRFVWALYRG